MRFMVRKTRQLFLTKASRVGVLFCDVASQCTEFAIGKYSKNVVAPRKQENETLSSGGFLLLLAGCNRRLGVLFSPHHP